MNESAVSELSWIRALDPIRPPYRKRLSSHSDLEVWHVDVEFEQWRIPTEMADRWQDSRTDSHETWRKRPLARGMASGCPYSCAEVELAARLRSGGLEAYWVSEWGGFPHVSCWKQFCVKRSEMGRRLPQVLAYDQRLRTTSPEGESLGRGGGHPDIVAWGPDDRDFVFLEYKGPGDCIKPKQNAWARAAVRDAGARVNYVAVNGIFRDGSEGFGLAPVETPNAAVTQSGAVERATTSAGNSGNGAREATVSTPRVSRIERIRYGGRLIILEDGSRWEVDELDDDTADMWGQGAEVLVWNGAMYLLDDLETIQVEPDQ